MHRALPTAWASSPGNTLKSPHIHELSRQGILGKGNNPFPAAPARSTSGTTSLSYCLYLSRLGLEDKGPLHSILLGIQPPNRGPRPPTRPSSSIPYHSPYLLEFPAAGISKAAAPHPHLSLTSSHFGCPFLQATFTRSPITTEEPYHSPRRPPPSNSPKALFSQSPASPILLWSLTTPSLLPPFSRLHTQIGGLGPSQNRSTSPRSPPPQERTSLPALPGARPVVPGAEACKSLPAQQPTVRRPRPARRCVLPPPSRPPQLRPRRSSLT
jgi:hypothetical protein